MVFEQAIFNTDMNMLIKYTSPTPKKYITLPDYFH